jgi:trans-aconitate methyltransferase
MVKQGLRVTGVDSSPTMISFCRDRLPDREWIVADMRQLALSRRFDGILAWDSFFHLDHDDQRQMFAIFADHASVGTVLMFNTGHSTVKAWENTEATRCITQVCHPPNMKHSPRDSDSKYP